jgi:hypothetical protein
VPLLVAVPDGVHDPPLAVAVPDRISYGCQSVETQFPGSTLEYGQSAQFASLHHLDVPPEQVTLVSSHAQPAHVRASVNPLL